MEEQKYQESQDDFRHLVRIANTDLDGSKPLYHSLAKIKGISYAFANAIVVVSNLNRIKKIGELSDAETKAIDDIINNPAKYGLPIWMFNRKKDFETGKDVHLVGGDLDFHKDNDIKLMKKIKSYKGIRHVFGLPVRGQRTKSNFRRNKGKVTGVKRKKGVKAGRT